MFKFLAVVALVGVISDAGAFRLNGVQPLRHGGRIVGGNDTTIEEVPYQVSLNFKGQHYCGGSIIAKNWIITAAHCTAYAYYYYTVRAGSSYATKGGSLHSVDRMFQAYAFRLADDVAVVHVTEPFEFDDTRQPIELFKAEEEPESGHLAVITGWGNTEPLRGLPNLQAAQVPIVLSETCNKLHEGRVNIGEICAGYPEGGEDTCYGDSGGPLAVEGRLVGISSWGYGCARPNLPGVYAKVATHRAWIKTLTGV